MTADGTNDELIQPEGLINYAVPPAMSHLQPDSAIPLLQAPTDADTENQDDCAPELNQNTSAAQSLNTEMPNEEVVEELEDREENRKFDHELVGRTIKGCYENGWFTGVIQYFNDVLSEFKVLFQDGSVDFISLEDIDGVELILL